MRIHKHGCSQANPSEIKSKNPGKHPMSYQITPNSHRLLKRLLRRLRCWKPALPVGSEVRCDLAPGSFERLLALALIAEEKADHDTAVTLAMHLKDLLICIPRQ
jgi:hypothetical protein